MGDFTKTDWTDRGLPKITAAQLERMEDGIFIANAPLVTSLPSSPVNGQECYYIADATNGVVWHLVYRTASSKWHYIGGPPLSHTIDTDQTRANVAYGDLATVGPNVTVPLAGDYAVSVAAGVYSTTANATEYMSYDVGATAASDLDAVTVSHPGTGTFAQQMQSPERIKAGLAASTLLRAKYRASAGTGHWRSRTMNVRPVQVS